MITTPNPTFSETTITLASLTKALGHPARITIVQFLSQNQGASCGEIVEQVPLAQPTVSQHLKTLTSSGLVTSRICGQRVCYRLEVAELSRLSDAISHLAATAQDALAETSQRTQNTTV